MRKWMILWGFVLSLGLPSCAHFLEDRGVLYTERGLIAASLQWHHHFNRELQRCMAQYPEGGPDARDCFVDTFTTDQAVNKVGYAAVVLLREYWTARAQGELVDHAEVSRQIAALIDTLPSEARGYFYRVKGTQ